MYLGLQDAKKKWRPISQKPVEWTGSTTLPLEGVGLFVMVSEKKWNKAKEMIPNFCRSLILLHPGLNFPERYETEDWFSGTWLTL